MKFSFKKLVGSLVLKQNPKNAQVDFLEKNQNWQTQKQSPQLYDQGAVPKILGQTGTIGKVCTVNEVNEEKKPKLSKYKLVKKHLEENGSINSWTAINLYRATRLSAIIYTLKNTDGMNIESVIDNKSKSHFATYILH